MGFGEPDMMVKVVVALDNFRDFCRVVGIIDAERDEVSYINEWLNRKVIMLTPQCISVTEVDLGTGEPSPIGAYRYIVLRDEAGRPYVKK